MIAVCVYLGGVQRFTALDDHSVGGFAYVGTESGEHAHGAGDPVAFLDPEFGRATDHGGAAGECAAAAATMGISSIMSGISAAPSVTARRWLVRASTAPAGLVGRDVGAHATEHVQETGSAVPQVQVR